MIPKVLFDIVTEPETGAVLLIPVQVDPVGNADANWIPRILLWLIFIVTFPVEVTIPVNAFDAAALKVIF